MSDQNETPQSPAPNLEAAHEARAEAQKEHAHNDSRKESHIDVQYHHSKNTESKEAQAAVTASAELERKTQGKLDPLELIRQVQKMREEGFDEATIIAAFNEVIGDINGKPRRPMRRVLKSEGMARTLSQLEINAIYEKPYKKSAPINPPKTTEPIEEYDATVDRINQLLTEIDSLNANRKALLPKISLKQRIYRAALYVLRSPVTFLINFLTAFRTARHQSKHGVYRNSSRGSKK